MEFNSIEFLLLFTVIVIGYFILPVKRRWILLLVGSYYFYMCWNPTYALLMLFSTLVTYLSGIYMDKVDVTRKRKACLIVSLVINLGILGLFKYYTFFNGIIGIIMDKVGLLWVAPSFNLLLPVGISFYTFQALSYSIDVYRGDLKAEKHFGIYALFVSFFPQLVAGPIERSTHLLPQFRQKVEWDFERIKDGLILMLVGFVKKVVIADRLAIVVNTVYNNVTDYRGIILVIATIFFSFQIFCDFSAYTDIARGAAKVLGFDLMENFKQPYLAGSIREFWKRWHISLTSWFRDYLYIPLGGNRVSHKRYCINILIVFLISGLWHGASLNFIIWGGLHGIYQVIEIVTQKKKESLIKKFKINTRNLSYTFITVGITFCLVNIAWVFFRANTLSDAIWLLTNIFPLNLQTLFNGNIFEIGLDKADFVLAIIMIISLVIGQIINRKINILESLKKEAWWFRWSIYIILIFTIIILGAYGEYGESQFIYFQF